MRHELASFAGQRKRFRARVQDFGTSRSAHRETILLVEVRSTDDLEVVLTDHVWLKKGKPFQAVAIGDLIEFDAEVEPYEKGYQNFQQGIDETTTDYRLTKPANVEVIAR